MSNLVKHAEAELRRAGLFDKDSDYGGMLGEAVMALVRTHSEQGHSGQSHAMTVAIFNRVVNFKTLRPISSDPSEWVSVCDPSAQEPTGLWQNNRQSSCFSRDGGKTWYDIDAPTPGAVAP
jgi:hypothetical protein